MGTGHNMRRVFFYSYPGHRLWARVINCVGFFFVLFVLLRNSTREAFATFACSISLKAEAKPRRNEATGIFQECLSYVRKAYFDRRTTQSEFCFKTNILCDRRSVQWGTVKFEVRNSGQLQNFYRLQRPLRIIKR